MIHRAGIGNLMRAGPAPGRAGLSHLGRGEVVLPNAAMNADPALRQRAMRSMAMQGRNPSQYTVGGMNSRNPMTGAREFADMIYTENGWVDPSTGQAMSFGGGNDFANSGTNYNGPVTFDPVTGRTVVASFAGLPTMRGREIGDVVEFADRTPESQGFITSFNAPRTPGLGLDQLAEPFRQAQQQGVTATPDMALYPVEGANPLFGGRSNMTPVNGVTPTAPQQNADSSAPDFGSFSAPQSYDEWRMSRNPGGKGVPNTLFGQTQTAGSDGGVTGQGMQMPNVMAGQMPVPGQQWGTPGTALGFARDNTANDPSILKSGYSDISLSPSVYSGAFGGSGFAPQSGIAFSGQGAGGGYGQQQNPQAAGNFGFGNAFRY
jgi:hypothetical protein